MKALMAWTIDHPRLVLAIVGLVTVVCLIALPFITVNSDFESYIDKNDPAYLAKERAEERFGSNDILMIALVAADGIYHADVLQSIQEITEKLEALPGVDDVRAPLNAQLIEGTEDSLVVGPAAPDEAAPETPDEIETYRMRVASSDTLEDVLVSEDGHAANIIVTYAPDADNATLTRAITDLVDGYRDRYEIAISGLHFMSQSLSASMSSDLAVLLPVVLVVIILVLYLSFRTLRGVILPLLVVFLSIVWIFGFMSLLSVPVTAISFILPVLLLAIGIAYGIHILNHYREACGQEKLKRAALVHAMTAVSSPVLMTGLTTVAGFMALLTSFLPVLASFGLFSGLGVLITMLLSLTLIPALLSLLPAPKIASKRKRQPKLPEILKACGLWVARHKRTVLVTLFVVLLAGCFGIPRIPVDSTTQAFLGANHPAVQGMDIMATYFSGSERLIIEIDTGQRDGLKEPAVLQEMIALEQYLQSLGVRKTQSLTDVVRDLNLKFHGNDPAYDVIPQDRKLISQLLLLFSFQGGDLGSLALRDFSAGEIIATYSKMDSKDLARLVSSVEEYLSTDLGEGITASLVGNTMIQRRMSTQLLSSQMISLATSVVIAAAIVALLMGSIVAGLIAVIPLAFAILIGFGTMGFAGMSLNIATAMISSITIGIGIDYAIHFIARYRVEATAGARSGEAIAKTMATSGQAILFNALAVTAGFLVLLCSSFSAFKSFGSLVSLAMALSAFGAMIGIPALFAWREPRFLRRKAWQRRRPNTTKDSEPQQIPDDSRDQTDRRTI